MPKHCFANVARADTQMPACFFCGHSEEAALMIITLTPLPAAQQCWYTPPLPATILACGDIPACQARKTRQTRGSNRLAF